MHNKALIYQKFMKFINSRSKHMWAIFETKLNLYKYLYKIIYEHTYFTHLISSTPFYVVPYASMYFIRWSMNSWHICYTWFVIRQAHSLQLFKCTSYSIKNMIYINTIIILLHHKHKYMGFVPQKYNLLQGRSQHFL